MGHLILAAFLLSAAPKIEAPKFEKPAGPKLDLNLPTLPKADGLSGPVREEASSETRRAPGDVTQVKSTPPKVERVIHAKEFTPTHDGYQPKGAVDTFRVRAPPVRIDRFKTCIRLSSPDSSPSTLAAKIRSPSGEDVLTSRTDVVFTRRGFVDVVIDWDGFDATREGEYKLFLFVEGTEAGSFPVAVVSK